MKTITVNLQVHQNSLLLFNCKAVGIYLLFLFANKETFVVKKPSHYFLFRGAGTCNEPNNGAISLLLVIVSKHYYLRFSLFFTKRCHPLNAVWYFDWIITLPVQKVLISGTHHIPPHFVKKWPFFFFSFGVENHTSWSKLATLSCNFLRSCSWWRQHYLARRKKKKKKKGG